jgi:alpha-ketoglutarate-dependent taurine dioxygenase
MIFQNSDPRAWTAGAVDPVASWYTPLPSRCRTIMNDRAGDRALATALRLDAAERAICREELCGVLDVLERGRGFVILTGVPPAATSRSVYWLVGQALGEPCEQNIQGMLLYDVHDVGASVAQGARFSLTNYESSFHTDNSFGAGIADYVGLLCLQPARSGGLSQLVSGHAVYRILDESHAEAFAVLQQPFHVDRRGGARADESPTVCRPVIAMEDSGLVFRYLRHWIEAGHQKAGVPLTRPQIAALDTLDRVLNSPDLRVEFTLRPGEMLFVNNRWLLHNRTAFVDFDEPAQRRHLVRIWLAASAGKSAAKP